MPSFLTVWDSGKTHSNARVGDPGIFHISKNATDANWHSAALDKAVTIAAGRKFYAELRCIRLDNTPLTTTANVNIGLAPAGESWNSDNYLAGQSINSWAYQSTGHKRHNSSTTLTNKNITAEGDTLILAVNGANLYAGINNQWADSGDPVADTNPLYSNLSGVLHLGVSALGASQLAALKVRRSEFIYSPPSGFLSFEEAAAMQSCSIVLPGDGKLRKRDTTLWANATGLKAALWRSSLPNSGPPDWQATIATDAGGGIINPSLVIVTSLATNSDAWLVVTDHSGTAYGTEYNTFSAPVKVTIP